ncbi:terpenoid cyclases/protein prenyltransferase alpha-alpha toroid [Coniochaeta sp. 2T2.1]|nr:terpenoid cyclases/protein prenyltransferase alpha-alpha toroid [Coniochaeta sp. 2T2.1]
MATDSASSRSRQTDVETEDIDEEFIHDFSSTLSSPAMAPLIPDLFSYAPPVVDSLDTETSFKQNEVVQDCLTYLTAKDPHSTYNLHGVARLERSLHSAFLHKGLGRYPDRFVPADASRPWYLYWCLSALTLLGEDVSGYRDQLVATAKSMQNDEGGFGGGCGQISHLATTYAVVLALTLVGGGEAYEVVDRRAMWRWLCRLKQRDGGFQVAMGGEEDIRGAYCAAVIITLLDLPLNLTRESPAWDGDEGKSLFTGVAEYVRRCQTFEGGISGQPDTEAHGAYAFCALGCLSILDAPERIIPKYLDVPRLVSWLSSRQYAPEGGFSGRTNKLVDGCYSHWVGGCWPLIEACLNGAGNPGAAEHDLPPASESLFSREGLIRYILCCCQDLPKRGGLRDKPGKMSDPYHSCYVLSGLSSAQHQWRQHLPEGPEDDGWIVSPYADEVQIFQDDDRVEPIHPVYVIPQKSVSDIKRYFLAKQGF